MKPSRLLAVEQREVDLVGRQRHAAPRQPVVRPGEQGRAVVGHPHVAGQAQLVAPGQPLPVYFVLKEERGWDGSWEEVRRP
jgi:hypothetical protein